MSVKTRKFISYTEIAPQQESVVARLHQSNYRLAEAVLAEMQVEERSALENIRTQCARGNVKEAERLACQALSLVSDQSSALFFELLIESSKIAFQQGHWHEAISQTDRILAWAELPAITKITVLQIRCTSNFELGEWGKALTDIDAIRTLRLLFPKSQASFYGDVLRLKILMRIQGPSAIAQEIAALWSGIRDERLPANLDTVLTLLRLQIDCNRLAGRGIAELALAAQQIAAAMGDELYSALAFVDLRYSESAILSAHAEMHLSMVKGRFLKVDGMLTELEAEKPTSETVRSVLAGRLPTVSDSRTIEGIQTVLLLKPALLVDLGELTVRPVDLQQRSQQIIEVLASGPQMKEQLFQKVWGMGYKPEQHDVIVRNALARIRKQVGVVISSSRSEVELVGTCVVAQ